jgi:hypothetical protein
MKYLKACLMGKPLSTQVGHDISLPVSTNLQLFREEHENPHHEAVSKNAF